MSEKHTRRAALGLMAAGGAVVAADTAAFSTLIADRTLDVEVAADREDAIVGILDDTLVDGRSYDEVPHRVELRNNFGEPVSVSADTGSAFTVSDSAETFGDDAEVSDGDETWFELDTDGGDATDTVTVVAEAESASAELDREITLQGYEPDETDSEFEVWLDATDDDDFTYSEEPEVDSWLSRAEEGLDSVDEEEGSLPDREADGWEFETDDGHPPTVAFEDDDLLVGSSVDLSETDVVSVVAVLNPDDGDRAFSLVDGGNDGQQIALDANDDQLRVALEDAEGVVGDEGRATPELPVGESPVIVAAVVEPQGTDDEESETFEVRTYRSRAHEETEELTDRNPTLGDFDLGVGGDPENAEDTELTGGEGFVGDVSEIQIYDRIIDDESGDGDELDDLVGYLEGKWGFDA